MQVLSSGLSEHIADEEDLSRFLVQSNLFNSFGPKPAAFLPNPKYRNTSVFRIGAEPERLRKAWNETNISGRTLKAAAVCKANQVRITGLHATAEEPPPAHANIEGWPWLDSDPELQKARQLELAEQIASSETYPAVKL